MGIYHDAYLINLQQLKEKILFYSMKPNEQTISQLSQVISELFDTNQIFRDLNSNYGGWDIKAIASELAENHVKKEFLALLIIYIQISSLPINNTIGLGYQYNPLTSILNRANWDDNTIKKLIYGNNFADYTKQYLQLDTNLPQYQYWSLIRPYSTGSSIGWLNRQDLQFLSTEVIDTQKKLSLNQDDFACLTLTNQMLMKAIHKEMDLCLIMSG